MTCTPVKASGNFLHSRRSGNNPCARAITRHYRFIYTSANDQFFSLLWRISDTRDTRDEAKKNKRAITDSPHREKQENYREMLIRVRIILFSSTLRRKADDGTENTRNGIGNNMCIMILYAECVHTQATIPENSGEITLEMFTH